MKFAAGDRVVVARKPDPMPEGWGDTWVEGPWGMDEFVGRSATVTDFRNGGAGFVLSLDGDVKGLTFPAEALDPLG